MQEQLRQTHWQTAARTACIQRARVPQAPEHETFRTNQLSEGSATISCIRARTLSGQEETHVPQLVHFE